MWLARWGRVTRPALAAACRTYSSAPPRNPAYATLTPSILKQFASVLSTPQSSLLSTIPSETQQWRVVDDTDLEAYNKDWMGKYIGHSACVVRPKSTEEVSSIMKICAEHGLAVVPQGGSTGLVGGNVPVYDEVILNLGSMNQVRSFDEATGTLVCDAGCVLQTLDDYLAERGFMMPLDLGAKGSCHIGGNVSTNAGGLRFLRYGSLHGSVLGLEVVLANGEILPLLQTLRKDNTGIDLKQLFIGSEGSLGIVTGVAITTPKLPNSVNVAMFGVDSFDHVCQTAQHARKHCAEILSALEFLDQDSFDHVINNPSHSFRDPFEKRYPMYVLIETSGSNQDHDQAKLQGLVEDVLENGIVADGVVAQGEKQAQELWSMRELVPESLTAHGKIYKYDVSLPLERLYELVELVEQRMVDRGMKPALNQPGLVKAVCGYGHVGDGNLHLNIVVDQYRDDIEAALEPFIYEQVQAMQGSISAEHGLGVTKADKIGYTKHATAVKYMEDVKRLFDPKGLLNPYKVCAHGLLTLVFAHALSGVFRNEMYVIIRAHSPPLDFLPPCRTARIVVTWVMWRTVKRAYSIYLTIQAVQLCSPCRCTRFCWRSSGCLWPRLVPAKDFQACASAASFAQSRLCVPHGHGRGCHLCRQGKYQV